MEEEGTVREPLGEIESKCGQVLKFKIVTSFVELKSGYFLFATLYSAHFCCALAAVIQLFLGRNL
jgi:hypothetical protein